MWNGKYHSSFPLYPRAQTFGKGASLQPATKVCYGKFHLETESKVIKLTNALLNIKNVILNIRYRNWHAAYISFCPLYLILDV